MHSTTRTSAPEQWAQIEEPTLRPCRFVKLPKAVARCSKLTPAARLLYGLLVDYARENEFCFPGQTRLAKDLGCSERSLQKSAAVGTLSRMRTW